MTTENKGDVNVNAMQNTIDAQHRQIHAMRKAIDDERREIAILHEFLSVSRQVSLRYCTERQDEAHARLAERQKTAAAVNALAEIERRARDGIATNPPDCYPYVMDAASILATIEGVRSGCE